MYNKGLGMLKRYEVYVGVVWVQESMGGIWEVQGNMGNIGNIGSMGEHGSAKGDKKSGEKWGVCV